MIIRSNNFVLKLEEILKEELPTERYNEHENFVLKIIRKWHSNAQLFTHQTSGSTGRPKKIEISREKIEISTRATMSFIDPEEKIKKSLLCLDPHHIGGAMVVYRSLICNHDLVIANPSSTPLTYVSSKDSYDFVSMVPLQFSNLTTDQINQFGVILIGGAPVKNQKIQFNAKVYSTFGMTETVSHIALRLIDEDIYCTTGDTTVATNDEQQLLIKGAITDDKWLLTNDIVDIESINSFKWIGRKDFVINSGGIKLNPETIENQVKHLIEGDFMIGSLPDKKLGRKIVLITDSDEQNIDFSLLDKYSRPKACYFGCTLFKTPGGKLDRIRTQNQLEK